MRRATAPPPPPTTRPSDLAAVAAAGRALFRQGLQLNCGVPVAAPVAARSVAAPPAAKRATDRLAVLVLSDGDGDDDDETAGRVRAAAELFWQAAERRARAACTVVPVGGGAAMRAALMRAGVPPHHVTMDCSSPTLVEGAARLPQTLRRLRTVRVRVVVASALQLPRARLVLERVLAAAPDVRVSVAFHAAPHPLPTAPAARADLEARERRLLRETPKPLAAAIASVLATTDVRANMLRRASVVAEAPEEDDN